MQQVTQKQRRFLYRIEIKLVVGNGLRQVFVWLK